ncbi:MAG: hypothetical protein CVV41_21965 [Candidatus Riflebacteria bacterium HGW-Riflebacteria-1]|jgi:voltage-gated potassium channel|nr:MAG: hypothetical protein CVV41_21965 [Candidatus Riflebacteria bacterium HGW-Riflebacteria-1]
MKQSEVRHFFNFRPEIERFRRMLADVTVLRLAFIAMLFLMLAAIGFAWLENDGKPWHQALADGLWWALVTVATVGYGDKYPVTPAGKILGMMVISGGVVIMTVFTATMASLMVERSIREGKGLETVLTNNHLVLCGINRNLNRVLDELVQNSSADEVVLVNNMDEEDFAVLKENLADKLELRFVKGDYSRETILRRAGIMQASSVIILADTSADTATGSLVDDRTILTTLTIKDLKPKIRICAEIVDEEKIDHVRRAGADEIVVQGGMSGFLLARGTSSPELPMVIKTLSDSGSDVRLDSKAFPSDMIGISFEQAMTRFLVEQSAVLVGIFRNEKGFSLESMLADGSAIDNFIRDKLKESKENFLTEGKPTSKLKMNPGRDYIIKKDDKAIIIAGR